MKNLYKNMLAITFLFLLSLTLFACGNDTVTFTLRVVVPGKTPSSDIIYFRSDLNNFEYGDDKYIAKATDKNNYYDLNLTFKKDELPITINYHWSRGSDDTIEEATSGDPIEARKITIDEKTVAGFLRQDIVRKWKDMWGTVVGNLEVITLSSDNFTNESQKTRRIRIWTPSNYDANDSKKYPVIYMHDGQNAFDLNTGAYGEWEADESMVALMEDGFSGAIIVGIDNTNERYGEYVYNHDFLDGAMGWTKTGHEYMDFIVDVVKPYIDQNYNTKPEREHTLLAGSSLGGLITLFGGLEHLDTFGNLLAFSSSTQLVNDQEALNTYFNNLDELSKETKYFFYVGTRNDGDIEWPDNYKAKLVNFGVNSNNIMTLVAEGYQHNEAAWIKHFPVGLKFIFGIED